MKPPRLSVPWPGRSARTFGLAIITSLICFLSSSASTAGVSLNGVRSLPAPSQTRHQASLEKLEQALLQQSRIRIIVRLAAPFNPAIERMSALAAVRQRVGITRAQEALLRSLDRTQTRLIARFRHVPYVALEVDRDGLTRLASNREVIEMHLDNLNPLALADSIPLVGADDVWSQGFSGAGQVVAILDSGVDGGHPFLSGKVLGEACFSSAGISSLCPGGASGEEGPGAGAPCAHEDCDHGTHVGGIAAGKGASFSGVARDAQLLSVQIFSLFNALCADFGLPAPCILTSSADQISALEWVYDQRASFNIAAVNLSIGGGSYSAPCDGDPRKLIIDLLRSAGIATVVSSGNGGQVNKISAPACISTSVSVGSTTKADAISSFSNISLYLDLLAPGSSIRSSVPGTTYQYWSGTSMAAPHVAGAWALLKSRVPSASVEQVLEALTSTGVTIGDGRSGGTQSKPRIQLEAALDALAAAPTNTPTSTPSSSPTATYTLTPTPTQTSTPTRTPSATPTATVTNTSTPTSTNTLTPTRTPTSTPTPTSTSTGTPTATSTSSQTATHTQTSTLTPTGTKTPTLTSTPTPSIVATSTATSTMPPTSTASPAFSASPTQQAPTGTPTPTLTPGPPVFSDVPAEHWARRYIEALYAQGFVAGCSATPRKYCPDSGLTRAESAVFVIRGHKGAEYTPPSPSGPPTFGDVPSGIWYHKWVEAMWSEGFSAGCDSKKLIYCPNDAHNRVEATVFFLRIKYGGGFIPTSPAGPPTFADVSDPTWWGYKWVEKAYADGLLPACETSPVLKFCPYAPLDRAWAAYMMVQAKGGLPLP